jgi:hypothetical protein
MPLFYQRSEHLFHQVSGRLGVGERNLVERQAWVTGCYDHLSGMAGERITERLLELGWITPEPAAGITPQGWKGLSDLGLNLYPTIGSRRRAVAFCSDSVDDPTPDHLGGHLGALLRQHFLQIGWLRWEVGEMALTPEGEQVLEELGVRLEDEV